MRSEQETLFTLAKGSTLKITNLFMTMNPVEVQAKQYYIHDSYIPVYYYVYEALEKWLANTVFREDRSRIILSSNEFAFRRRFELTDMTRPYKDLEISSLHFPFANYWPMNIGWDREERIAANPATLLYTGLYTSRSCIRASNANIAIPVNFYFDREDDARFAYSKLYFYTFNEFSQEETMTFQNEEVGLPVVISIKSLQFNPQYNETDWLKQNRIFIVSATVNLRTYIIAPPEQPLWDQVIVGDDMLTNGETYDDGNSTYNLVRTVEATTSSMGDLSEESFEKLVCEGEIKEPEVLVNYLRVDETTDDSVKIVWDIENASSVATIGIKKAGEKKYTAIPPDSTSFTFTELSPDSTYKVYVKFTLSDGTSKRLSLNIRTREAAKSPIADSLIGISW